LVNWFVFRSSGLITFSNGKLIGEEKVKNKKIEFNKGLTNNSNFSLATNRQ